MYRQLTFGIALFALATWVAPASARAEVKVVATVPDLAALAKEVGGARAKVTSLSLPTQDPHFVDAKPSLMLDLNKADLLVAVGLELEVGWLPTLQTGARNADIQPGGKGYLECAAHVGPLLEVPAQAVDRSMGDIHPGGNPHYLYDPARAARCAGAIADKLIALDPDNAEYYRHNLTHFEQRLARKQEAWKRKLAAHRGASVITYHKSWVYLADWLGLDIVEHLEPKPGIPPSPRHVVRVLKMGKAKNVDVILQESFYPNKTGKLVASKLGAKLVQLPGGADFARGQSYLEHMDALVDRLAAALGG